MHRSRDPPTMHAPRRAHPAPMPPTYVTRTPPQPRPPQGISSAPKRALPSRLPSALSSTRIPCASAGSRAMRRARATGWRPSRGRIRASWPPSSGQALRLTRARHTRKAPNEARSRPSLGQLKNGRETMPVAIPAPPSTLVRFGYPTRDCAQPAEHGRIYLAMIRRMAGRHHHCSTRVLRYFRRGRVRGRRK